MLSVQFLIRTLAVALLALLMVAAAQAEGVYTGSLTHVIGDVKQGQILNKLDTKAKVDNVLSGIQQLGCDGVRITIFPTGENPNPEMFDYLFEQAKKRGFKIFANPAQHSGAQRLAHRDIKKTGNVKNLMRPTQILIKHVIKFAKKYPCDWINPFNEDGAPGKPWTGPQMEFIYQNLYKKLNGAELVGPCTWGIPAGIRVLSKTRVSQYITVATTHNLGHQHDRWPEFQHVAKSLRLPVWDSEVNMHKKFPDKPHRLDAALTADVDGLVLYHAWTSYMNINTGKLNKAGQKVRRMILVDENQTPTLIDPQKTAKAASRKYKPKTGDIMFQSTPEGQMFDALRDGSEPRFSHCGILVRRRGQWLVLEAETVVKETPIKEWVSGGRNKAYDVYRLKRDSKVSTSKWIAQARKFIGRPYDTQYKMSDERIYGSELVYKSFLNATGEELAKPVPLSDLNWKSVEKIFVETEGAVPLKRKLVTPQQIAQSSQLEHVYSSKK